LFGLFVWFIWFLFEAKSRDVQGFAAVSGRNDYLLARDVACRTRYLLQLFSDWIFDRIAESNERSGFV